MEDNFNVTHRKPRKHNLNVSESELGLDTSFESSKSEIRRYSLPDLSTGYDSDKEDLKMEIKNLKQQLESAHLEIEKLCNENTNLKTALQIQTSKSKHLQLICSEPKRKTTSTIKIAKMKNITRNLELSLDLETNNSCIDLRLKNDEGCEGTIDGATSLLPRSFDDNISNATEKIKQKDVYNRTQSRHSKSRLCIISSNQINKILPIAQTTFPCHNICHNIFTNCSAKYLINSLSQKLLDYTKNDYCLVFIGHKDFMTTINYYELVLSLCDILKTLNHTNIILCLPTYKFNGYSDLYNSRIEYFGNLLIKNLGRQDNVTIFDSNKFLVYDETMFYKRNGVLNNYGMKTIFQNLKCYYVKDLNCFSESFKDNAFSTTKTYEAQGEFFLT